MARLRRRTPDEVRRLPSLLPGERPLAWATGGAEGHDPVGWVVATDRALHVTSSDGVAERMPWDLVDRAAWEEPVLVLSVRSRRGAPPKPLRLALADAGDLPVAVRERVVASIVVSERVRLDGDRGARVVARRGADDGQVRWSVVFDPGLDPTDPRWREIVDGTLSELRGHVG